MMQNFSCLLEVNSFMVEEHFVSTMNFHKMIHNFSCLLEGNSFVIEETLHINNESP